MDSKLNILQKVEEALGSLDHIVPAAPAPFFYTRLEAKLMKEESSVWERISRVLTTPVIAFASVGLVLLLNTFAMMKYSFTAERPQDQQEIAIADEYSRTMSAFNYNIDNVQP